MTNHPNRGKNKSAAATPLPDQIKAARGELTPAQAAALIYCTATKWEQWEAGTARMHPAMFELFQIKQSGVKR